MSSLSLNSNPDSTNLAVPKLRDDGSNWADYAPRIQKAMGSKGLWRHIEGKAVAPTAYTVVEGIPVISDGKTPATEEQIEARETRIIDYEKREYLAQHVILSTTSTRVGAKIKDLKSAKEMWDVVKSDATTKSSLYLLDAEDELASMKLSDTEDPKTHLAELKEHFQLMTQHRNNLIEMGSVLSDTRY
jgi:gag-polypeptide of LTR copia-type